MILSGRFRATAYTQPWVPCTRFPCRRWWFGTRARKNSEMNSTEGDGEIRRVVSLDVDKESVELVGEPVGRIDERRAEFGVAIHGAVWEHSRCPGWCEGRHCATDNGELTSGFNANRNEGMRPEEVRFWSVSREESVVFPPKITISIESWGECNEWNDGGFCFLSHAFDV